MRNMMMGAKSLRNRGNIAQRSCVLPVLQRGFGFWKNIDEFRNYVFLVHEWFLYGVYIGDH